jgi:hypothetical protein
MSTTVLDFKKISLTEYFFSNCSLAHAFNFKLSVDSFDFCEFFKFVVASKMPYKALMLFGFSLRE